MLHKTMTLNNQFNIHWAPIYSGLGTLGAGVQRWIRQPCGGDTHRPIQGNMVSDKVERHYGSICRLFPRWERKGILRRIMEDKRKVTSTEAGDLGLEWRLLAWKQEWTCFKWRPTSRQAVVEGETSEADGNQIRKGPEMSCQGLGLRSGSSGKLTKGFK